MAIKDNFPSRLRPLVYLSNNPLSFLGVLLTTTAAVTSLFLLPVHFGGEAAHPYLGILFFLVVPVAFFAGLAFIPLGIVLRGRKHHRQGTYPDDFPKLNWSNPAFRQLTSFVAVATVANVVFGGHLSSSAVHYMDSVGFCGQSCHVMTPQYTAYQVSSHAQIGCVECHVGEGAVSAVRAKLNGVRQLVGIATGSYPRPIPTPVHGLRPARQTCGKCHWSGKSVGDRLHVLTRFAEDETNTVSYTVLLMHIGGGADRKGIHGAHLGEGVAIEYYSDESRETISWVGYTDTAGRLTEYAAEDWEPEQASRLVRRLMDCTDCHNRPAHTFELAAGALDDALGAGEINPSLPLIKKVSLDILQSQYESREEAGTRIPKELQEIYRKEHPETAAARGADIEQAGQALLGIYERNIFPEMNVTWGTYPNQIGHTDFPGCFRCHDDLHSSPQGDTITQDCGVCHELLAMEEESPEILTSLGIH